MPVVRPARLRSRPSLRCIAPVVPLHGTTNVDGPILAFADLLAEERYGSAGPVASRPPLRVVKWTSQPVWPAGCELWHWVQHGACVDQAQGKMEN